MNSKTSLGNRLMCDSSLIISCDLNFQVKCQQKLSLSLSVSYLGTLKSLEMPTQTITIVPHRWQHCSQFEDFSSLYMIKETLQNLVKFTYQ